MELNEEQMRTELAEMAAKADRITDESLESTRRMLAYATEAQGAGGKTMEELYEQGEQLDRVEEGLDQINSDMKAAEKNLTEMEKCCGLCVCPWNRKRNIEKTEEYKKTWDEKDGVVVTEPGFTSGSYAAQTGYIQKCGSFPCEVLLFMCSVWPYIVCLVIVDTVGGWAECGLSPGISYIGINLWLCASSLITVCNCC
eukprot:m.66550 g.66550  ORF g.66550 m.66550 type:complete len:198 (+) comp35394_c0_seq1:114-707(+)